MIDHSNTNNHKLIQLKIALENGTSSALEWIIDKFDNIDMQVAPTSYIKLHHPDWIGNTVLHFAHDRDWVLNMLLDRDADYTIKNQDGQTVVHYILRRRHYINTSHLVNIRNVLKSSNIDIILSAHTKMRNPTNPSDNHGMTHFHIACMANHVKAVKLFLDNDVCVDHTINSDSPYFAGFTPLHLAAKCCCLDVAKLLLNHGANIYLKDSKEMTAAHVIIDNIFKLDNDFLLDHLDRSDLPKKYASQEIAKLLLQKMSNNGTKIIDDEALTCFYTVQAMKKDSLVDEELSKIKLYINQSGKTESEFWPGCTTVLHLAARMSCKAVKNLVKRGADLGAKDASGITPLDLCVERYKSEDIYEILSLSSAWKGITCCQQNHFKLLDIVLALKDCDEFTKFSNSSVYKTGCASVSINSPLWPGFTLMHFVVLFSKSFAGNSYHGKYLHMMRELHDKNAIYTARDSRERTPLHLAFRLGKMKEVINFLCELHSKFDYPIDFVDDENLSLLHIACTSITNHDLLNKLLVCSENVNLAYKGKSINNLMETGWTPLHVAVANRNFYAVRMLLACGADIAIEDINGVTPIHLTMLIIQDCNKNMKSEIAEVLLSAPSLKESVIKDIGLSHLHVACTMNNEGAIRKLISKGSNVNLSISRDPKMCEKSFELSNLTQYLGLTSLQLSWNKCGIHSCDLLMKLEADIFVEDFAGAPFAFERFEYFSNFFKQDDTFQMQAEMKFSFTKIHTACFLKDLNWLKSLLKDDHGNVNKQIDMNLLKWSGFTPLHVVMIKDSYSGAEIKNEFVKLLLDHGADVTITDSKQQTPIHMAYSGCWDRFSCVIMMLKAQKDYSINPTDIEGLSHFHIACDVGEHTIVKKFLERGDVDINQPIDFFSVKCFKFCQAGFTPLHMAAICGEKNIDITPHLETVDLLLKHGADPNFQSSRGNTPLHVTDCWEIFERITRDGADANAINLNGDTPLGYLLDKASNPCMANRVKLSIDQIMNRLRCGCIYNAFPNSERKSGYIGLSIQLLPFEELQKLFKIILINMPETMRIDEKGRTVIHNIVSSWHNKISIVQYATLIDILASAGFDIDSRDHLGRTALHSAAKLVNSSAVSALLMTGVDANIRDNEGKTALAHSENDILIAHLKKLQLCQLETCESDKVYVAKESDSIIDESFFSELGKIANITFGSYPLTLLSLLSETNTVADYPTMSQLKRDSIDEFFRSDNISHFREKYSEVAGLLHLQYRKAIARSKLLEDVMTSFPFPAVPKECLHIILGFLSNSNLKSLIASTEGDCKSQ